MRTRHYARTTEQNYLAWCKQFILYHHKRHPNEMGETEIRDFLSYLANERNVAAATQDQALAAILFLYKQVLQRDLLPLGKIDRAKKPQRLPVVMSRDEVLRT